MESTFLKYGDWILLYSESGPGFLQSQGFTNPGCYIQHQPKESKQSCRNFRDFVFKVEPRMNYDAKKDYEEILRQKEKATNGKDALFEIEQKLKLHFQKMMEEEEINRKHSQMKQGEWITYGNEIQLMHSDSRGFVCANKVCADYDRSCNKIEITEKGSSAGYFKVLPRYKFRQEGEKVLFRDQIVLLNVKTNLYLHITEKWLEMADKIKPKFEDWRPLDADRRDDPSEYVKRFEVNCSTSSSRFQPLPQTQVNEDPTNKLIKGHQVVRLQHTELGGYLTSDDLDFTDDELAEVYVKCFNGDINDIEAITSGDLFELEIATNYDKGQVCIWSEPDDARSTFNYRFRHLNSGRLVRVQEVIIAGKKIISLGLADHATEENSKELLESTLFNLYSTTVDSDNRIRSGTSLKIQSVKTKQYLSTKADQEWTGGVQGGGERSQDMSSTSPRLNNTIDQIEDELFESVNEGIKGTRNKGKRTGIYHPLDDDELYNCRNNVIELSQKALNEDAFMINLVDQSEVQDLLFVQTVSSQLYRYTKYLRSEKLNEIDKDMQQNIIELLIKLISFVTNTESNDPKTSEGSPNKPRQKLMRELRVVEL